MPPPCSTRTESPPRAALLQDPSPESGVLLRESAELHLHRGGEARVDVEQLIDVPRVLWASGVELEEDQVRGRDQRNVCLADPDRGSGAKRLALPRQRADDQVDRRLVLARD